NVEVVGSSPITSTSEAQVSRHAPLLSVWATFLLHHPCTKSFFERGADPGGDARILLPRTVRRWTHLDRCPMCRYVRGFNGQRVMFGVRVLCTLPRHRMVGRWTATVVGDELLNLDAGAPD